MTIKTREEFDALVKLGYKPKYHSKIKRWYLYRGRRTELVDKSLEDYARELGIKRYTEKIKQYERILSMIKR
jgi:hypothetical protein